MSYTNQLSHIIFLTEDRKPVLKKKNRDRLFQYMTAIIKNRKSTTLAINGVEDHIHILCDIHPTEKLSELVKSIKVASSKMIKEEGLFKGFEKWQNGYAAFSISASHKSAVISYIEDQEAHHNKIDAEEELSRMYRKNQIEVDAKHLI